MPLYPSLFHSQQTSTPFTSRKNIMEELFIARPDSASHNISIKAINPKNAIDGRHICIKTSCAAPLWALS
jgi:hypothetical protein